MKTRINSIQIHKFFRSAYLFVFLLTIAVSTSPIDALSEDKNDFLLSAGRSFYFESVEMGEIRDIAVNAEFCYVLVRGFNLIADAVFQLRRSDGRVNRIWGIGNFKSAAIESDGKNLWVLVEKRDSFIRIFTFSGNWVKTLGLKTELRGSLQGLGIDGDRVYFTQYDGQKSELCQYDSKKGTYKTIYTFNDRIDSLCMDGERVVMYQNSFSAYSDHWLLVVDFNPQRYKILRFINDDALGLASSGKNLYFLSRENSMMGVHPFAINKGDTSVLARPVKKKLTFSFHVKNTAMNKNKASLWIPCPLQNEYQNIKDLHCDPEPNDVVSDRYGNKWAHYNGDRIKNLIVMKFEITGGEVGYTINKHSHYNAHSIPAAVLGNYTGKTSTFDIDSPEISSIPNVFPREYLFLSRLLGVRNYVIKALAADDEVSDCNSASCYMKRGKGSDRGIAVAFAAVARLYGLPTRVIGGYFIPEGGGTNKAVGRSWNQVYVPECGWVDVDPGGETAGFAPKIQSGIGYRPSSYCVMFQGNLETPDYRDAYVAQDWRISVLNNTLSGHSDTDEYFSSIEVRSDPVIEESKPVVEPKKKRTGRGKKKK